LQIVSGQTYNFKKCRTSRQQNSIEEKNMSTRVLPDFSLVTPTTLQEAIVFADNYQQLAQFIAGGTDLIVNMKSGSSDPGSLIQIGALDELYFLDYNENAGLKLGPLTTVKDIEASPIFKRIYPLFVDAANVFANVQLLNMATIGGNICNASPAGDLIPPLMSINAEVELLSVSGTRTVGLVDFFKGPGKTVMKDNEILGSINAPPLSADYGSSFVRISRTAEDLAKVSASVVLKEDDGKFKDVRISLGAVAPTVIRIFEAEEFLEGRSIDDEVIERAAAIACETITPISDLRSTAAYRKQVTGYATIQAIKKSLKRSRSQ